MMCRSGPHVLVSVTVSLAFVLSGFSHAQSICDFNEDGVCNSTDVQALVDQGNLVSGVTLTDQKFDLTGDGLANIGDLNQWFREAVDHDPQVHFSGDANLDGVVDRIDLNLLALNWQGVDKVWSEGDFNRDGTVNAADLMTIGFHWQQSEARNAVSVPEPAAWMFVFFALNLAFLLKQRKQRG